MGMTPTLTLAGAAVVLAGFCGWRGARAPDMRRGPRMVPWRFLMLLSGAALLLLLTHAAALSGLAQPR